MNYQNILVVRTDRIGDVVLTTPAIKALHDLYPQARISVLVRPYTKDLVVGNPYIHNVLLDDREGAHRGVLGFFRLVKDIRRQKFDLAVIYHTKRRTNLVCSLAGIPHRLGYKNDKFGFLLNLPVHDTRHLGEKHEAQYCMELLGSIGIKPRPLDLFVPLQESAQLWIKDFYREYSISPQERLIAIHPGASDPSRCWPPYYFAKVMEMMSRQKPCRFILIGDPHMQHIARQISAMLNFPVIDVTGKTSLSQLIALLCCTQVLISNDSGPVHIASALKVPVVTIFMRNQPGINPERWHPLGENSRTVSVPPNMNVSFKKAQVVDSKYLELIKPEAVLQAVDALDKLC